MGIIEIIQNCTSFKEYILNCYIYCLNNFSTIQYDINNNFRFLKTESNKVLLNLSFYGKEKLLEYFLSLKCEENPKKFIINLLAIDNLLIEFEQKIKYLHFKHSIKCNLDNNEYIIISKPVNIIYQSLKEKNIALREPKNVVIDFSSCFNNFMICQTSIDSYSCSIKELKEISSHTDNLLLDFNSITMGLFSNFKKPDYIENQLDNESSEDTLIYFSGINNQSDIDNEIQRILNISYQENISIVLLPELFVYDSSRKIIKNWLKKMNEGQKIVMVVAGSCHKFNEDNNECINESIIYDCYGNEIYSQNKFFQFFEPDDSKREYLSYQNSKFICIESAIGRFSISICLDFISESYLNFNKKFSVNINFVPALSSSLFDFKRIAQEQGRYYSASTFCSNTIHPNFIKPENKGFMYVPMESKNSLKEISSLEQNSLYYLKIKLSDLQ